MRELFEEAVGEFKRADHLIFVSLKYTRTVDVFRSIVDRLTETLRLLSDGILGIAKRNNIIDEIPISPKLKTNKLREAHPEDKRIQELIEFYLHLRKLQTAPYTRRCEFRRHVTMTSTLPDGVLFETTIDVIEEYYKKTKSLIDYINEEYAT